ncbi:MAG TPA: hypothetical protein VKB78_05345, partial [Pirellulales bacterium]|nr:hypothetical protein [Pirellulales bacterium]
RSFFSSQIEAQFVTGATHDVRIVTGCAVAMPAETTTPIVAHPSVMAARIIFSVAFSDRTACLRTSQQAALPQRPGRTSVDCRPSAPAAREYRSENERRKSGYFSRAAAS